MNNFIQWMSTNRGHLFNLAFIFYVWLLQKPFIQLFSGIIYKDQLDQRIVWSFVALQILEFWALHAKMQVVSATLKKAFGKKSAESLSALSIGLWVGHLIISMVITMFVLKAAGADTENLQTSAMIVLAFQVFKEIALVMVFIFASDAKKRSARPNKNETVADIILILNSWIVMAATWQALARNVIQSEAENASLQIVYVTAAGVIFLIFYLPLRIPYLVEEILRSQNSRQVTYIFLSILVTTILVLLPLFFNVGVTMKENGSW